MIVEYDITPTTAPRMTKSDKWKKRPIVLRYRAFRDEVRLKGVKLHESGFHITFVIPMSESWSDKKKERLNGQPHKLRPDWDNLAKALFDAVYEDDCMIHDVRISKVWGYKGKIIIDDGL